MSWDTKRLGELVDFKTGKLDSNAATLNGSYPFFTCSSETLLTNTWSFDGEYVLLAGNNASGIFPLKWFSGRFNAYQRTYVVRPRLGTELSTRYLYYALHPKLDELRRVSTGAATKFLTLGILNETSIVLPPLPIQHRIADVLSAYDDLIENCQRRIRILEDMARSLYREWFVEFRFPGHEGVKLVPSALGEIPEGWEPKKLTDVIQINPKVRVLKDGSKAFVPMGCLSTDSLVINGVEHRDGNSGVKFQNGDTLVARISPCLENGKTGLVSFLQDADAVAFGSTEFMVLRSKSVGCEFVYCFARSEGFRSLAIKSMSGATGRQRVQERVFQDYLIPYPPLELLRQFEDFASVCFKEVFGLDEKSRNLRQTRDLLLPRLMSGQLDVERL